MPRAALSRILQLLFASALAATLLGAQSYMPPRPSLRPDAGPKRRVLVTDSNSWSISGGFGGSSAGFGGATSGGARPQTVEVIKTFGKKCHGVTVTMNRRTADFVVLFDHEGGKGWARKDNKIAVFNRVGDAIFSRSTRTLGSAVEDACKAIMAAPIPPPAAPPAPSQRMAPAAPAAASQPAQPAAGSGSMAPAAPSAPAESANPGLVFVKSSPAGADITVDGGFVGDTPSDLRLPPGKHQITVHKSGFKSWQRTMTVFAGGSVSLNVKLKQAP